MNKGGDFMGSFLEEFFVVTLSRSVYRVWCDGRDFAGRIEKIHSAGGIGFEVGTRFKIRHLDFAAGNNYIGVGTNLYFFQGASRESISRLDINSLGVGYLGFMTAPIVALFLKESFFYDCVIKTELAPYDPRWAPQTKETQEAIGFNHPRFILEYPERERM